MTKDIVLDKVSVQLAGKTILNNISLSVQKGEFLGVIGPNGSGKTTFMKLLLGLIKPKSGDVVLLGSQMSKNIAKQIGYVPQSRSYDPDISLRAQDFVSFGLKNSFVPWLSKKEKDKVQQAIELAEAQGYAQEPIGQLSGGQRQRLFLAQALVNDPSVLLLDEPTSNLDPGSQERMALLVDKLRREQNITVIFISHDLNLMARYADRILYLTQDDYAFGNVQEVVTTEVLSRLYKMPMKVINIEGEYTITMETEAKKPLPICVH